MFLVNLLVDVLLHTVCAWIGYIVVKVVTLGRVDLAWNENDGESVLAEWIGVGVLVLTTVIAALVLSSEALRTILDT